MSGNYYTLRETEEELDVQHGSIHNLIRDAGITESNYLPTKGSKPLRIFTPEEVERMREVIDARRRAGR